MNFQTSCQLRRESLRAAFLVFYYFWCTLTTFLRTLLILKPSYSPTTLKSAKQFILLKKDCHIFQSGIDASTTAVTPFSHFIWARPITSATACSSKRTPARIEYQLNGSPVNVMQSFRDLGVICSSDLSWSKRINKILGKAYRSLYFIKRSCPPDSTPTYIKKSLYLSLIVT